MPADAGRQPTLGRGKSLYGLPKGRECYLDRLPRQDFRHFTRNCRPSTLAIRSRCPVHVPSSDGPSAPSAGPETRAATIIVARIERNAAHAEQTARIAREIQERPRISLRSMRATNNEHGRVFIRKPPYGQPAITRTRPPMSWLCDAAPPSRSGPGKGSSPASDTSEA